MTIYEKMEQYGYKLPEIPPKGGIYKPVKQVGNLLFVSGQGATKAGVPVMTGKVGSELTLEQGREAARICTLNALSTLEGYLEDLNKVKSVVKILAFVASSPGFNQQPKVIDAASEILKNIMGDINGVGARTAVSAPELPGDIPVEIEFIFEI